MGVSIPPYPLNDLAGAVIATCVRWRRRSGFVLRLPSSAPRDVIVPCAAECGICTKCEQRAFAPAAHGEAAKRQQSGKKRQRSAGNGGGAEEIRKVRLIWR